MSSHVNGSRDGMKPDWKDAPEWAQWLTMDEDYQWWWHETCPVIKAFGIWHSDGRAAAVTGGADWESSIEERPE
jgi:hypothetical protein